MAEWQLMSQIWPGSPLAAPRSQVSPSDGSTKPSPQKCGVRQPRVHPSVPRLVSPLCLPRSHCSAGSLWPSPQ